MPRTVWPNAFLLRSCELAEVFANGRSSKVVQEFLPTIPGKHVDPGQDGPAVALRWTTAPHIGFPRQPFEVFRRPPTERYVRLVVSLSTSAETPVEWGLLEMYEVRFTAEPDPGATLVVEALDRDHEVIPGQRISFSVTQTGRFRSPGIAALRVYGTGTIRQVLGLDQTVLANGDEWVRIQVVGFPFAEGEVAPPVYDSQPEGIEPPSLNGLDAAKVRLQIAELLHLDPPATGIADIPTPDWPAPEPGTYLDTLRDPKPSSLGLIRECLENTKDEDLGNLQMNYYHHAELDGIQQVDIPGSTPGPDPAVMDLPVPVITMLSISGDSYGATALGYGTVDFPPRVTQQIATNIAVPPGTVQTPFLYMVTTTIIMPFGEKREIAALAQACPLPDAPGNFTAATLQRNRPPERDAAVTEAVRLQWDLSSQPQGYGVAVSRKSGECVVLNPSRGESGGINPYIPERPEEVNGATPPGVRSTFIDPVAPVPITGVLTSRYLAIGLDVFGRWSAWRMIPHSSPAVPVILPGLHGATLSPNGPPNGRLVPSKIEIEFSWNWEDRSVERIEFSGTFYPVTASPPATLSTGFALTDGATLDPNVVVAFDAGRNASVASGHQGTVLQLDPLPDDDPEQLRYRVTVEGRSADALSCDFTGVSEVAYAVFARATERIRPAEPSAVAGPLKARFPDPIPPVQPTLPVDLRWTALPDAAGRAHAVLTWPAAANAAGYIVWEGTEAALRNAVDPSLPEPPAGTSLFDRASDLTALVTAFLTPESEARAARSMQAFARLNTELIRTNQVELDLPGRADSLYAYRVSSVSTTNLESPRSNSVALFAVPKRNQPGQPKLLLRVRNGETERGIDVIALAGTPPRAVGYRVYRVRKTALLNDFGLMGPPKIEHDDPAWRDFDLRAPDGSTQRGRAVLDAVTESWLPYYYRVVALGEDDPAHGQHRGESLASIVQQAFFPPTRPPGVENVTTEANSTNRILRFTTDLPVKSTPLGIATVELVRLAARPERMIRTRVVREAAHEIPVGAPLTLLDSPTQAELDALPEITRGDPDPAGKVIITVRVHAEIEHGVIMVTDPLGRTTETDF